MSRKLLAHKYNQNTWFKIQKANNLFKYQVNEFLEFILNILYLHLHLLLKHVLLRLQTHSQATFYRYMLQYWNNSLTSQFVSLFFRYSHKITNFYL